MGVRVPPGVPSQRKDMTDKDTVNKYFESLKDLKEVFGSIVYYYSIEDNRDKHWQLGEFNLRFCDKNPSEEKEWTYSEDIYNDGIFKSDNFTLVIVDTCSSYGKLGMLLSNENEYPDWEFEWE